MGLLHKAERAEQVIQRTINRLFGKGAARQPLELRRAILDEIDGKIEAIGAGARAFPFNRIEIQLFADGSEQVALYEVAFLQDRRLENAIRHQLGQAGCEVPADLEIDVAITEPPGLKSEDRAFHVECRKRPPPPTPEIKPKPKLPHAQLTVLKGQSEHKTYTITKARINMGRLPEVVDRHQRVVRRNDIVFVEAEDEVNQTVGREHAHIQFNEATGEFRLCDDHSANGTRIFRGGRSIEVPGGNRRGARLLSGDEIYLGQACIRFEVK
jgi:hypothetical protein